LQQSSIAGFGSISLGITKLPTPHPLAVGICAGFGTGVLAKGIKFFCLVLFINFSCSHFIANLLLSVHLYVQSGNISGNTSVI